MCETPKTISRTLARCTAIVIFCMTLWFPPSLVYAAITLDFYPAYVASDGTSTSGTPFVVHVLLSNLSRNATYYLKCAFQKQNVTNYFGYTWNSSTWVEDDATYSSYLPVVTDSSGAWSGWLYCKTESSDTGYTTYGPGVYDFKVGYYTSAGSGPTWTSAVSVQILDMSATGNGGWLEEPSGTTRAGRAVAVKNGSSIVGLYVAEDNGVNEGYSGTGYYKIAVPICTTCNYSIETWNLTNPGTPVGRTNTMPDKNGANSVSAGQTTTLQFDTPTAIRLSSLAGVTLSSIGLGRNVPTIILAGMVVLAFAGLAWARQGLGRRRKKT